MPSALVLVRYPAHSLPNDLREYSIRVLFPQARVMQQFALQFLQVRGSELRPA